MSRTDAPETEVNSSGSSAHAEDLDVILTRLRTDPDQGLAAQEAARRLAVFGPNVLKSKPRAHPLIILAHQFASPIVYLLGGAALVALILGEFVEFTAIIIVLAINSAIGFATEWRAVKSMEALRSMSALGAHVRRDGVVIPVRAETLVAGDIIVLEAGDVITADLRLVEVANLEIDESTLTGESLPVAKSTAPVPETSPLAERSCMAYKGCAVTSGNGVGVVVATGMKTELGRITKLVESAESTRSPLTEKLEGLTRALIWLTLAVAIVVAIVGLATGRDPELMVGSAIALAVAAIPEGLPIVATLALARGMMGMARRNALIEQLAAVETLGATTVILTDKTGTLTENRMHVARVMGSGQSWRFAHDEGKFLSDTGPLMDAENETALRALFWAGVACTNAELDGKGGGVGDPMEIAILEAAQSLGIERDAVFDTSPRLEQIAFDTKSRRMASIHRGQNGTEVAVKGAPEAVLPACVTLAAGQTVVPLTPARLQELETRLDEMAGAGLRLLAIAGKSTPDASVGVSADAPAKAPVDILAFDGLTLYGIIGFHDPPRPDIAKSLAQARAAGIKVVMVTGDHGATARAIAAEIGLAEAGVAALGGAELAPPEKLGEADRAELRQVRIFSRVTPEQKLNLIGLHQQAGEVVAMTGDGVNDAPALKKADIGIAMGQRGTQVAREAADMVLQDDAFSTIVAAVAEGRAIWVNIRRFTVYLLSCNLSEILIVGLSILAGLPLPLLPLQILFLNLVTDVFPAFALGTIAGGEAFLNRPPRDPSEPLIGPRQWRAIAIHGLMITFATLMALILGEKWLGLEGPALTTLSFYTLALAQLWHVFNMRNWREGLLTSPIFRSPYVWGALVLCLALIWLASALPATALALNLVALPANAYALVMVMSLLPVAMRQSEALWDKWRRRKLA